MFKDIIGLNEIIRIVIIGVRKEILILILGIKEQNDGLFYRGISAKL